MCMILIGISFRVGEKQNGFDAVEQPAKHWICCCILLLARGLDFICLDSFYFPSISLKK